MMIMKRLILFSLIVFYGGGLTPLFSQNNLILRFVGGTEKSTALSSLSKITFLGSNMVMTFTNGSFEAVDLLSVQKIGFTILNGVESVVQTGESMFVYPSPAIDRITLANLPEGARMATIFRLDGSAVERIQLSSNTQAIDVSNIPSGFYLLRVNNSTVKFAKK